MITAVADCVREAWSSRHHMGLGFANDDDSEIHFLVVGVGFTAYYRLYAAKDGSGVLLGGHVGKRIVSRGFDLADPAVFGVIADYVAGIGDGNA